MEIAYLEDYLNEKGVEFIYANDPEFSLYYTNVMGLGGGGPHCRTCPSLRD